VAVVGIVALAVGRPFKGKTNGQGVEFEVGDSTPSQGSRGRRKKKR